MTAEGSTGAPLRQQIAEAILSASFGSGIPDVVSVERLAALQADAVVALLNLTEELGQRYSEEGSAMGEVYLPGVDPFFGIGSVRVHRYVTPWLPSTPPPEAS